MTSSGEKNRIVTTREKARKNGASGLTAQKHKIIVTGPFMEILIGSAYTESSGEEHPYGHTALRVVNGTRDITYDFGRYGETKGAFESEGEGVLNVWSVFKAYITHENMLNRTTTGYVYHLEQRHAVKIIAYYDAIIATRKEIRINTTTMRRYVLTHDYDAIENNCTTMTLGATAISGEKIIHHPEQYQELRGLSWVERQAARTQEWDSDDIFMPGDLKAMIEDNKEDPYDKKNIYP